MFEFNETSQKLIGILFTGSVLAIGWLTRNSGRRADKETTPKKDEPEDTKSLTLRDLVLQTFGESRDARRAAESSAAYAAEAGSAASTAATSCETLKSSMETTHGDLRREIKASEERSGARIDTVAAKAEQALALARAAAGGRSADEVLRRNMTPPGGVVLPPEATEG